MPSATDALSGHADPRVRMLTRARPTVPLVSGGSDNSSGGSGGWNVEDSASKPDHHGHDQDGDDTLPAFWDSIELRGTLSLLYGIAKRWPLALVSISLALDGHIERGLSADHLRERLRSLVEARA